MNTVLALKSAVLLMSIVLNYNKYIYYVPYISAMICHQIKENVKL